MVSLNLSGSFVSAGCNCGCKNESMRVANFDMTDPNQNCPDGFVQVNNADPPLRLCGRPGPIGCSSMFFAVNGTEYSVLCGRVKAYQHYRL